MGFGSPIVRQARHGQKPDGVCLVVGSCARGFSEETNQSADLIYTTTDIRPDFQGQYFWEAFPAGSGPKDRTTYMFTYLDADPSRPSLASLLDDYWDLMPQYQGLDSIDDVELLRVLFGMGARRVHLAPRLKKPLNSSVLLSFFISFLMDHHP